MEAGRRTEESGMTNRWRLDVGYLEVEWGIEGGWMVDDKNEGWVEVGWWLAEE